MILGVESDREMLQRPCQTAFQSALPLGSHGNCSSYADVCKFRGRQNVIVTKRRKSRLFGESHLFATASASNGIGSEKVSDDVPNDVPDDTEADVSSDAGSTGDKPKDVRERLLKVINRMVNDQRQTKEIEELIIKLESFKLTPITPAFTELGLAGRWNLIFSSTRTKSKRNIRIRKIGQSFDTENKKVLNEALWSFPSKSGSEEIFANLTVLNSYKFVGPGRMEVSLEDHKVEIVPREDKKPQDMPDDLKALITDMQLSLPVEFFDPSGLVDVSFLDPSFRLARFVGKRAAGVRNVFTR